MESTFAMIEHSVNTSSLIEARDLEFRYRQETPLVIQIEHFRMVRGEKVFLYGPSGCGKTTLLGLLAGMFPPTTGEVSLLNHDLAKVSSHRRDGLRGAHVGYIFQLFNLIPYLSVEENILLPIRLNTSRRQRILNSELQECRRIGKRLGIEDLANEPVANLSVGQQQRVAAARALIGKPELVIADEPTSALDFNSREEFLSLMFAEAQSVGSGVLFVSHDPTLAKHFDRQVELPSLNKIRAFETSSSPFQGKGGL